MSKIAELKAKKEALKKIKDQLETNAYDIERRLRQELSKQLGVPSDDLVISPYHTCPDTISKWDRKHLDKEYLEDMEKRYKYAADNNELGRCVYNGSKDPRHNNCLFCGDPSERK